MSFVLYLGYIVLLYLKPIETYYPELHEFRLFLLFSILAILISVFELATQPSKVINRRHIGLIGAFIFIVPFSRIIGGWPGGAVEALLAICPPIFTLLLTIINVNTLKKLKITIFTVVACTSLLLSQSLYSYHTGFKKDIYLYSQIHLEVNESRADAINAKKNGEVILPVDDNSVLWRIRSVGELSDPNDFAQTILAAIPLLFIGFFAASTAEKILFRIPFLLFLLYGFLLTGSRGGVVAAAVMVFFGSYRRLGKIGAILLLISILIGGVALGFSGGREISSADDSAGGRIDAWGVGLNALKQQPIFGVGFGRFLEINRYTAHNAYILVMTELGLLGYFIWVALSMNSALELLRGRRAVSEASPESRWANCVIFSFTAVAITSIFLSRSYSIITYLWIGLMACAGFVCETSLPQSDRSKALPWVKFTLIFCLASYFLMYVVIIFHNLTK
jgi:O-antigen ligase